MDSSQTGTIDTSKQLCQLSAKVAQLKQICQANPACLTSLLPSPCTSNCVIPPPCAQPVRREGRPSYLDLYPEIPDILSAYLQRHAIGAEEKRCNESINARNVTIRDMTKHLNIELRKMYLDSSINLSWTTVRRIGLAPNKSRKSHIYYKGAVEFRQPARRNDLIEDPHLASHYTLSLIKCLREAGSYFEEEVMVLSSDNKNKIPLGNTAVSHMNRPHGMHLTNLAPNAPDHSFPKHPDSAKITPSGYMELQHTSYKVNCETKRLPSVNSGNQPRRRCRSLCRSRNLDHLEKDNRLTRSTGSILEYDYMDKYGRPHFDCPNSGHLHLCLFPTCFYDAVSCRHLNNMNHFLSPLVKSTRRKVLINLVDGGPDWTFKSLANIINFGRFWLRTELDAYIVACYAPRHSKYNLMERRWGTGTKILTNVRLSHKAPGDDKSPWDQPEISEQERQEKIDLVIENACDHLAKLWDQEEFDGFKTTTYPIRRNDPRDILMESEYNNLKAYLKSLSVNTRAMLPAYLAEANFLLRHLVRNRYKLEFKKRTSGDCNYCQNHVIQSKRFFAFFDKCGGSFPVPQLHSFIPGRYQTFVQLFNSPESFSWKDLPEFSLLGTCEDLACRYTFYSAADQKRHNLLAHGIVLAE